MNTKSSLVFSFRLLPAPRILFSLCFCY